MSYTMQQLRDRIKALAATKTVVKDSEHYRRGATIRLAYLYKL